ncbi:uncharacterized protein LOC123507682 [Portunus trituberculatus]|uniref:uncharacterized protein LOC123507682 n=1 Tax=Portunus trituberculatus TaxID=210409 RepID=UPI001E1CFBC8|nr:uncharacterized protein LOC123507682 [Portunus trituberculatus]
MSEHTYIHSPYPPPTCDAVCVCVCVCVAGGVGVSGVHIHTHTHTHIQTHVFEGIVCTMDYLLFLFLFLLVTSRSHRPRGRIKKIETWKERSWTKGKNQLYERFQFHSRCDIARRGDDERFPRRHQAYPSYPGAQQTGRRRPPQPYRRTPTSACLN